MIALLAAAEKFYRLNSREYHNYDHANTVVRVIGILNSAPSIALLLAGQWHDAFYFPGADKIQPSLNECASAAALYNTHKSLKSKVPQSDVDRAMELIIGTSVNEHLSAERKTGDQAILLDADLSSLADPWLKFIENQHNIIHENYAEVNESSLIACSDFLMKLFSCREWIYHTDTARELYEVPARMNIITFRNMYGGNNELPSN